MKVYGRAIVSIISVNFYMNCMIPESIGTCGNLPYFLSFGEKNLPFFLTVVCPAMDPFIHPRGVGPPCGHALPVWFAVLWLMLICCERKVLLAGANLM